MLYLLLVMSLAHDCSVAKVAISGSISERLWVTVTINTVTTPIDFSAFGDRALKRVFADERRQSH
jgi:hypothetical protein